MKALKIILPIVLLVAGATGAALLVLSRPSASTRIPEAVVPLVRALVVEQVDRTLIVQSQGTVQPLTASVLAAEVGGRIVEVSPEFVVGGFFDAGDVLLRIEPLDYEQAVVQAEAQVARARLALERERAEADVAIREWGELGGGEAPPLTRREPQLAEAEAALRAAEAALKLARRNLERTTIRAPYAGRVSRKQVDLGRFVAPGTPLGEVYAIDAVEVRLPVPDDQLAFLDLTLDGRRGSGTTGVTLSAEFAGAERRWTGRIVRAEGEIDPRTRMLYLVARVDRPYARSADGHPPLTPGMYVRAKVEGRRVEGLAVLPRAALRDDGSVLIVDAEDRLRFREVDVLRLTDREAIVQAGLDDGERVCVSQLATVTDGMRVRIQPDGGA